MKLTQDLLDSINACQPQQDLLWKLFKPGTEITPQRLTIAYQHGVRLRYAINYLWPQYNREMSNRCDSVYEIYTRLMDDVNGVLLTYDEYNALIDILKAEERKEYLAVYIEIIMRGAAEYDVASKSQLPAV